MGGEKEVIESREWVLMSYAGKGFPTSDHLKLRTVKLTLADDSFPDRHVAVQILLLSVDPYIRTMMTGLPDGLSLPQIELNQVVKAFGIGRVIKSKNDDFTVGDIVSCPFFPLGEYCVTPPDFLRKIDTGVGASLPEYLSALGVPGFAAWVGIELIGDPKPGESIFISAAAGGVGMFAGQLAKIKGCRVVGSAGSDEKVKLLQEEFAYDDAFNYKKETDFDVALSKYFPNGIDVYLDNVGGRMLEAVLNHVNKRARIPLCGMISQYNQVWNEREGVRNLLNMVGKEVKMEGFMLGTFINRFGDFSKEMEGYIKQGKINTKHHIYHGIESFLESLVAVFSGSNVGKVIIQVNNELEA